MEEHVIHFDASDSESRAVVSFFLNNGISFQIKKYNKEEFDYSESKCDFRNNQTEIQNLKKKQFFKFPFYENMKTGRKFTGNNAICRYISMEYKLPFFTFPELEDEIKYTQKQCWFKSDLRPATECYLLNYTKKRDTKLSSLRLQNDLAFFEKWCLNLEELAELLHIISLKQHLRKDEGRGNYSDLVFYTQVFQELCQLLVSDFDFGQFEKTSLFMRQMWRFDAETFNFWECMEIYTNKKAINSLNMFD